MVDSKVAVSSLVDQISDLPRNPPSIYLDLEGENLSRHGTLSLIQIYISTTNEVYLVDVHTLGKVAFLTQGTNSPNTLKYILESSEIQKAIFDVRRDSDALYSHFDVSVAGIQDIQLMEVARRPSFKKYLNGLSKCIDRDANLPPEQRQKWLAVKEKGHKLFSTDRGGSFKVFSQRPLSEDIKSYCVQDVQYLARLWQVYDAELTPYWRKQVEFATIDRIILSQSKSFNSDGRNMALSPF